MSEADNAAPIVVGQPVEFLVPARLESLAIIRTLVSALGTLEDLDLDAVADLRLALDEACTALIRSAAPDSRLTARTSFALTVWTQTRRSAKLVWDDRRYRQSGPDRLEKRPTGRGPEGCNENGPAAGRRPLDRLRPGASLLQPLRLYERRYTRMT